MGQLWEPEAGCLGERRDRRLVRRIDTLVQGERGHAYASEDGWVYCAVADTGAGIPAEVLPRIFEPFFSTKRSSEGKKEEEGTSGGGTGLGLTICHELIRVAGGTIRAESAPGSGAVFTIELVEASPERSKD